MCPSACWEFGIRHLSSAGLSPSLLIQNTIIWAINKPWRWTEYILASPRRLWVKQRVKIREGPQHSSSYTSNKRPTHTCTVCAEDAQTVCVWRLLDAVHTPLVNMTFKMIRLRDSVQRFLLTDWIYEWIEGRITPNYMCCSAALFYIISEWHLKPFFDLFIYKSNTRKDCL